MRPDYWTVYDIAGELLPHPGHLIVTVLLLLAGAMHFLYRTRGSKVRGTGWLLIAGGVAFGAVTCLVPIWDVHVMKQAERKGTAFIVEGPISGHVVRTDTLQGRHPQPLTFEGFTVGDVRFGFYREQDGAGFHNSGAHPIDLSDGRQARVTYLPKHDTASYPNRILRLQLGLPGKGTPREAGASK
ncbi:MAG: hypothetical protein QM724_11140 [Flavobacteriales bacterium]